MPGATQRTRETRQRFGDEDQRLGVSHLELLGNVIEPTYRPGRRRIDDPGHRFVR